MLFFDVRFLFLFFPACLLVFYLGKPAWRLNILIIFSLIFYSMWRINDLVILLVSMGINYAFIWRYLKDRNPRYIVPLVFVDLAVLAYFKYLNFFLSQLFGNFHPWNIALPLGISFYTFHQISLLLDLKGGRVKSITFREYMLYIMFFPQLIAGPIVRFPEVEKYIRNLTVFTPLFSRIMTGFAIFIAGLVLKLLLADSLSPIVDQIFEELKTHTVPARAVLVASLAFYLQLFFDFSGYTAMAIGLGIVFRIKLPPNFRKPYAACNIVDFWSRWHMTLTRLITDYLYSPLSLNWTRQAMQDNYSNRARFFAGAILPTMIAFVLIGVWHGAGWTFVIFGLYHAIMVSLYRLYLYLGLNKKIHLPKVAALLLTQIVVLVGWVFFRAGSMDVVVHWFGSFLNHTMHKGSFDFPNPGVVEIFHIRVSNNSPGHMQLSQALIFLAIGFATVACDLFQPRFMRMINGAAMRRGWAIKTAYIALLVFLFHLCVAVTLYKHDTFIYFQF